MRTEKGRLAVLIGCSFLVTVLIAGAVMDLCAKRGFGSMEAAADVAPESEVFSSLPHHDLERSRAPQSPRRVKQVDVRQPRKAAESESAGNLGDGQLLELAARYAKLVGEGRESLDARKEIISRFELLGDKALAERLILRVLLEESLETTGGMDLAGFAGMALGRVVDLAQAERLVDLRQALRASGSPASQFALLLARKPRAPAEHLFSDLQTVAAATPSDQLRTQILGNIVLPGVEDRAVEFLRAQSSDPRNRELTGVLVSELASVVRKEGKATAPAVEVLLEIGARRDVQPGTFVKVVQALEAGAPESLSILRTRMLSTRSGLVNYLQRALQRR